MLSFIILSVVMLSAIMLNVDTLIIIMLNIVMLIVIMLNIVKLRAIMLSVMAPLFIADFCHASLIFAAIAMMLPTRTGSSLTII
jgi:hypothetical protein